MLPDVPSDPALLRKLERLGAPPGVAVALGDPAGCVEWVNGAFQRLTGYPAAELTGKRLDLFRGLDIGEPALDYVMARFRQGIRSRLEIRTRGSRRHPPRWLDVEVVPLGPDEGFAAIVRDVTERRSRDPERREEADAAREEPSPTRCDVDPSGPAPVPRLALKRTDLSMLVMQSYELLEAALPRHTLLDLDLAGNLPAVKADVPQLRQALVSLVRHAADSLEGAPGAVRVRTGLRQESSRVTGIELEVRDTGFADTVPTARTVASRTRPTQPLLGLPEIRRLIEAHRGSFEFARRPGVGGRALAVLPCLMPPPASSHDEDGGSRTTSPS